MLFVEDVCLLDKCLVAVSLHIDTVRIGQCSAMMSYLTAVTVFVQELDTGLKDVFVAHVGPAIEQIVLFYLRDVGKTIAVTIVCFGFVLVVSQQHGAPFIGELHRCIGIGFVTVGGAGKEVGRYPVGFCSLWLFVFQIDLSGQCFVAVFHR